MRAPLAARWRRPTVAQHAPDGVVACALLLIWDEDVNDSKDFSVCVWSAIGEATGREALDGIRLMVAFQSSCFLAGVRRVM